MALDDKTLELYSRQVLVDEIGYDGQERILSTQLAVRGPARLRALAVRYLKAAGLQAVEEDESSSAYDLVTLKESSGRVWKIRLPDSTGAGMRDLGLAMARVLFELVTDAD